MTAARRNEDELQRTGHDRWISDPHPEERSRESLFPLGFILRPLLPSLPQHGMAGTEDGPRGQHPKAEIVEISPRGDPGEMIASR